jgi:hypothetical protein
MKIHALSLTCDRDLDLSALMVSTLMKQCNTLTDIKVFNTDHNDTLKGYENGAGWKASMMKLACLRNLKPADDDFVLSVDSDVVFCSPDVFKELDLSYGIIGIKHRPEFHTHFGDWSHMSGALIFMRGDILKKMCALSENKLNDIRYKHFKAYAITENEDVVLSYLASYVGANQKALPGWLSSGDFECDVDNSTTPTGAVVLIGILKSFYHLNYCPTMFLGEPVSGKWDIPKVLKLKGIEL